ncbi:MAG: leucine-rich repeat domain-containing protein [Bacteroidales bacterium]|nr:leucine-rich repeat domain-containing protein [Bacteroidales bacterium]
MKAKFIILAFVILLCSNAFAYDFSAVCESGQTLFYNITSDVEPYTVKVTYESCDESIGLYNLNNYPTGNLVIPESVSFEEKTYSVTLIGHHAFAYCTGLVSVTIPNSVTTIETEAFHPCHNIESVTLSNSLTTIGARAFEACWGMLSIDIPNSVTYIGSRAFSSCGLTSLTIPYSVTNIGEGAFKCSNLESIVVELENTHYDSRENCNALIETETNKLIRGCINSIIPNSVSIISKEAFAGCSGLTGELSIPNSVSIIERAAFYGCNGMTSVIIPNSVISIGIGAFTDCTGLTSVYYTGDLAEWCEILFEANPYTSHIYGANPLYHAHNLYIGNELVTDLTIPETLTEIKLCSFCGASCLKSITIPESVISIEDEAFGECTNVDTIIMYATIPPTLHYYSFDGVPTSIPVIVPCGSASTYNNVEYWSDFTNIQEDCSGVEENEIADLHIYPNPVGDILNITSSETISEIEIVNVIGQVVYREDVNGNNAVCDVNELANGIYVAKIHILNISKSAKVIQRKFIKE